MRVNVFGKRRLVKRDRREVGIDIQAVGIGVVAVAAEDSSRQKRVPNHAQGAQRVSPAGANALVFLEPAPLLFRIVAVDVDRDVGQVVPIEIGPQLGQRLQRDLVVVDLFIESDDPCRQADDSRDSIEVLVRLAKFDCRSGRFRRRVWRRRRDGSGHSDTAPPRRSRRLSAGKRGQSNWAPRRSVIARSARTGKKKLRFGIISRLEPSTATHLPPLADGAASVRQSAHLPAAECPAVCTRRGDSSRAAGN